MIDFAGILKAGISDRDYHADRGTLSASGARSLLACPARFAWERENGGRKPKRHYDLGHLAHKLILGEGADLCIIDAADYRTQAAQEQRDAARAVGAVPVLQHEYDDALVMRRQVFEHPAAGQLLDEGVAELSGYWRDEPTDIGLRFRPDWLTALPAGLGGAAGWAGRPVCVDVKTAASAQPWDFQTSTAKIGYHCQAAWYLDGLIAHGVEDPAFLFIVVEKVPPYPVSVVHLDDEAIAEGRRLNRQAIDTYARCLETGIWPGYSEDIVSIGLPPWALPDMEIEA